MTFALTKLSETASSLTLGWTPPPGVGGYVFYANGVAVSTGSPNLKDGTPRKEVKFSKTSPGPPFQVAAVCREGSILLLDVGTYSEAPPPPTNLPSVISAGGTYSGTATGTVQVRTAQPVIIENSSLSSTGLAPCIDANHDSVDLTVRFSTLTAQYGQHVKSIGFKRIHVERCDINGGWGVRADNGQNGCTFLVTRNRFRNQVYGNHPDWLAHSIQLVNTLSPALAEISWNECIGVFGQSQTEDVISLYNAANAKVHDNYVQGAYPASLSGSYTGGGIIVDGPQCHHNELYDNIVVDTMNYCLAIAGGRDNKLYRNRAVCDSRNDAGQPFTALSSGGIGIYVADYSSTGAGFTGNTATANTVGVRNTAGDRADAWSPISGAISGTTALPNPIDKAKEDAEYQRWLAKLAAAGVVIGFA